MTPCVYLFDWEEFVVASILVICEQEVLRSSLASWLEAVLPDCQAIEARGESDGLSIAERCLPRLVIFCTGLSEANRLGEVTRLKKALPDTPIVVLTSYAYPNYCTSFVAAGATTCLSYQTIRTELQPMLAGLLQPS
jgi:DNA-binding NarL/FixJ family response regulator